MSSKTRATAGWSAAMAGAQRAPAEDQLLSVVDWGLCGIIFVAPYIFGGRHDLGRLVLVGLIAITAIAWFTRLALKSKSRPSSGGRSTLGIALVALATALLLLQITPLPSGLLVRLSPALVELLPVWNGAESSAASAEPVSEPSPLGRGQGEGALVFGSSPSPQPSPGGRGSVLKPVLGPWQTLSITPYETVKSLAMLVSYGLLFVVVLGRIRGCDDIERLLKWVALSTVLMATFGLLQSATSDGRFFWFYEHPHRLATTTLNGPFINRNHFAHFLVLGFGPLVAWLILAYERAREAKAAAGPMISVPLAERVMPWVPAIGLVLIACTVLLTRSRGGIIVLFAAGTVVTVVYALRGMVDRRFGYGLTVFTVAVIGVLSIYGYDHVVQRMDDFTEGSLDDIDHGGIRRKVWSANLAAFSSLKLAGAGAGSHREVLPVYMQESFTKEYTHAENGYLQIATETGLCGLTLLALAFVLTGASCVRCLRNAREVRELYLFGAIAAGLGASVVHSLFDFVWYIPACMSLTVVLVACVLRLGQEVGERCDEPSPGPSLGGRGVMRWTQAVCVALIAGWGVLVYAGPGVAAVYWDRYLRASVADTELKEQELTDVVTTKKLPANTDHQPLNDAMLRNLQQVVEWDPQFARARVRLAAKYLVKFELLQRDAANSMGLAQIRDACVASAFQSPADRNAWLERAVGANIEWLRRAASEAREAVALCPLQGEAYVYLAELCFLDGGTDATSNAYVDQAIRVRPHDSDVLFEIGKQELLTGEVPKAMERWQTCFRDPGPHQLKIVYLLAGHVPAPLFLETFQPDWHTLREIWDRYRQFGSPQDLEPLLAYSLGATKREMQVAQGTRAGLVWFWQSRLFADVGRKAESLACLQQAYASHSRHYAIRRAFALALHEAGSIAEAESHLRWCLARRPTDKELNDALLKVAKQRFAVRRNLPTIPSASAGTTTR